MVIHSKLSDGELLDAVYKAAHEYSKLIGNSYLIVGKNRKSDYLRTINEKISCCAEMLQIQEAKYMKVGLKDKISQYVDFTYGYGSMVTLGFQKQGETAFPITLIPKNIDEFVAQKYKIAYVLQKDKSQKKYGTIVSEIKKGIFKEMYEEFPDDLRALIDKNQMKS